MKPYAPRTTSRTWMLFADLMLVALAAVLAVAGHLGDRLTSIDTDLKPPPQSGDALMADLDATRRLLAEAEAARNKAEAGRIALVAEIETTRRLLADAEAARKKAEADRIARTAEYEAARSRVKDLQDQVTALDRMLVELRKAHQDLKADFEKVANLQQGIHQELLGLKSKRPGRLGKVALLIDTSGSMDGNREGQAAVGVSRWLVTKSTIRTWLEHLSADEVVLIRFHSIAEEPRVFRVGNAEARKKLVDEIESWKPAGLTATHDALVAAYARADLDAIILFTDGQPTEKIGDRDTSSRAIYKLLDSNKERGVPINVVAIGQYFDVEFSTFLLELARRTAGSFQGR